MEIRAAFWQRHRWFKWVGSGLLLALVLLTIAASIVVHRAEPFVRTHIVEALAYRFHARVELDSFHMSLLHGLRAEGKGLRIWAPAQVRGVNVAAAPDNSDPLISLDEFRFHAPLHFSPGKPFHIGLVELEGLNIHVPPKSHFGRTAPETKPRTSSILTFSVEAIECTSSHFVLETDKPGKMPLDFAIARFNLTDSKGAPISNGSVMHFEADLTNPKPVGTIHTVGDFGPWQVADPGENPIEGQYTFDHADLASFKGIGGMLSSTGKYQGTLRNITVDGDTDTPDFRLTHFGNTLPLHTHFHAHVDGTNGDTWLEPVDAVLGRSHFTAQGQIVRVVSPDQATGRLVSHGHDIALNIAMQGARIEDFLHLASKTATPLLTGSLAMKAALHIPPGAAPVHKRLTIKGAFNLDQVRFASANIQNKITDLSLRGQGHPKEIKLANPNATRSTMQSSFTMGGGVIALPALTYTVPGATIQLTGNYGTEGGTLDFTGKAKLDAPVSQIVGGVLGIFLKPADRFFRKDGAGTEVPIFISGTRQNPEFGLDFHRKKNPSSTPAK